MLATLSVAGCAGVGGGLPQEAGGSCRSCFIGMPPALTEIPGTRPERRRLDRDLSFVDGAGLVWKANAGDVTDGASIPDIFLPITGTRFDPHFLPAAIVHDHYTDRNHLVRTWKATARVFYEGMRANRTPAIKAKLMYYAVYAFGPHWGRLSPGQPCGPNCVNLTGPQSATLREMEPAMAAGPSAEYRFQPAYASSADLLELRQVRAKIVAGEKQRRPLSVADLESEAAVRHPANPFLADPR